MVELNVMACQLHENIWQKIIKTVKRAIQIKEVKYFSPSTY